jgi:hypothetical protein
VVRIDRDQQIAAIDQFAAAPEIPEGNREAAANTNCRRSTQFRSLTANSGLVSLGPSLIESYRNAAADWPSQIGWLMNRSPPMMLN